MRTVGIAGWVVIVAAFLVWQGLALVKECRRVLVPDGVLRLATPDLALCLTTKGIGITSRVTLNLFDSCLQNFFWNFDNHGLKLLQLRFYPKG